MAFNDPIFSHRNGEEQPMKSATMEAWLENRAYSTWPRIQTWEVYQRQLIWQSRLMRTQFSSTYIRRALYVSRTNERR